MTVSSTTRKAGPFLGNGVTTSYPFTFKVFAASDLQLTLTDSTGADTELTLDGHYSVSLNADQDNNPGGTITYPITGSPMPVGYTLVGLGNLAISQGTDITNLGRFLPQIHEDVFDKLAIYAQQLMEKVGRALLVSKTDATTPTELPGPTLRAGKYLAFDGSGQPTMASGTGNDSALRTDLEASNGSALVNFLQAGTGAVARTLQDKMREHVSVLDFMTAAQIADVTSGAALLDVTAPIQKAIDYVMLGGGRRKLHMPAGRYRTTDTLHLGYGASFQSIVIEGDGYSYRTEAGFSGTAIICDFSDRPGINFQGARGSVLRGVALLGKNFTYLGTLSTSANDWSDAALWVDPAIAAASPGCDSRYAPYAAITIDAYSGVAPATAYPAVSYPAVLGAVAQYGKNHSSDVQIEDVYICGFVAGVVNKPSNSNANADFTAICRVTIERCKYGISVGNTQSRTVRIEDVKFNRVYVALTNNTHGSQQGQLGGTVQRVAAGECANFVNITTQYAAAMTFLNCYAESTYRLGTLAGGSSNETPIRFQDCNFNFSLQNADNACGIPAQTLTGPGQPAQIIFQGCAFNNFPSVLALSGTSRIILNDCAVQPTSRDATITEPYKRYAHNALGGGIVVDRQCDLKTKTTHKFKRANLSTGVLAAFIGEATSEPTGKAVGLPFFVEALSYTHPYTRSEVARPSFNVNKATLVSWSLVNTTLTIELPNTGTYTDAYLETMGGAPGDIIVDNDTTSVFFIRSRTTRTIIAELQNNYKTSGGASTPVTAISGTVGSLFFSCTRLFAPGLGAKGDLTAANPDIANVQTGGTATMADIAVNDYLAVNAAIDKNFASSPKVTGIVGQTVTVSLNAQYTLANKALPLWIAAPPANA